MTDFNFRLRQREARRIGLTLTNTNQMLDNKTGRLIGVVEPNDQLAWLAGAMDNNATRIIRMLLEHQDGCPDAILADARLFCDDDEPTS